MTIRYEIILNVLEAAKDNGDEVVIAACRRLLVADRKDWRQHHDKADWALVLAFA